MIEIKTTAVDAFANLDQIKEIAPGVYQDLQSGALYVTDGRQTVSIGVTKK